MVYKTMNLHYVVGSDINNKILFVRYMARVLEKTDNPKVELFLFHDNDYQYGFDGNLFKDEEVIKVVNAIHVLHESMDTEDFNFETDYFVDNLENVNREELWKIVKSMWQTEDPSKYVIPELKLKVNMIRHNLDEL